MNRIAELRKKSGLSQKELGDLVKAAQNTISNWENGTREPSIGDFKFMAKYFGVTMEYLTGDDENEGQTKEGEENFSWLDDLTADQIAEKCYEDFKILFSRSNKSTHEQMKGFYIDAYKRFNK